MRAQYETVSPDQAGSGVNEATAHLLNGALLHNDGYRVYTHRGNAFLAFQVRRARVPGQASETSYGVTLVS